MKKSMMAVAAGLGILLTGCATTSPYVGTWSGEEDPGEEIVLKMTEQGRFMAEVVDEGEVLAGTWTATDKGHAKLVTIGRESEDVVITLITDDEMVLTADGKSVKFSRQ